MPTGNPVASTPGVSHSKSFRSRLGFGGSGSAPSTKPSFFSLKPGRKSIGGPGESRGYDRPILVIDAQPEHGRSPEENHVVLNDETERHQPHRTPSKSDSPTKDLPFQLPSSIISHSLPASPSRSVQHTFNSHIANMDFQSSINGTRTRTQVDPDDSGISKHLPDLSTDLSLLMNEQPPDTESQSDIHESKASNSDVNGPTVALSQGMGRERQPAFKSSPAALDMGDQPRRWNVPNLAASMHQMRPIVSSPPRGPEGSESAVSGWTNGAVENVSTSFDLSSAKLSLDLMRQSLGDDWARSIMVEDSAAPGADNSALLGPPVSSLLESNSGPITSTPFRSPNASLARPQDADVSFNLDALDPDLVALLRPRNYDQGVNRVVTPSPLEPFAPPPDPLNPDTTAKPPPAPPTSLSSSSPSHRLRGQMDGVARSPVRKYATLTASTSPLRSLQLPRSTTTQNFMPRVPSPFTADTRPELQLLQTEAQSDGCPPSAVASPLDAGTASDVSKQPSPLSAAPLTLGDLERRREPSPAPSPAQSSAASTSTSNYNNVTTRRKLRTHTARPGSALTSSTDSRPIPHHSIQDRDYVLRQASASPSPSSPGPSTYASGSLGRERDRTRPSIDGIFPRRFSPERSAGRPNSASGGRLHNVPYVGSNFNGDFPAPRERDVSAERRYRKRSMSLDQSPAGGGPREDSLRPGTRLRLLSDRDRLVEWTGSEGSEFGYGSRDRLDAPFDSRYRDRDRDREQHGYGYGDRERHARLHTDWLGPRTAKAFAAAGLLDDSREPTGLKYGAFSRSASERDFRSVGMGQGRERERWSPMNGANPVDNERDRGHYRYNFASSVRSGSDRDYMLSGVRAGAETPSTASMARPPSRGESSSYGRPAPLFARTMSDLMSQRGSADGREGASAMYHRPGSTYSPGTGGESAGSGGGRASPTTTSSLVVVQSQIQTLKEKHDTQTEALLAALADSQKTARELKEENEALQGQLRVLEERLVETIASSRQKEKEFARAMRARQQSPERMHNLRPHRNANYQNLPAPPPPKPPVKSMPSPTKRRLSTSSSIFPTVPASMSLLMAETPGSPPQGSLGSDSRPPSPTLVLPKLTTRQKSERREMEGINSTSLIMSQPIPISHKRSTSGASMATSANFSFETGSPGSLKLKPEHELLLGDMTKLSLVTGFGGDSENEG